MLSGRNLARTALLVCFLAFGVGLTTVRGTDLAPGADIVLSEILYNPPLSLGGDELFEYVELHNRGAADVDVSGWRLQDRDDNQAFFIPRGHSIPPGGYLVIARDAVALRAVYGAELAIVGDFDFGLDNGGDTLRLLDDRGQLVDRVEYDDEAGWPPEADGKGASIERVSLLDDITDFTNFLPSMPGSLPGTPGAPNSRAGEIAERHHVVWNEIMFHPVKDPDAESLQHCIADEFVELHNRGPNSIDISGWIIAGGVDFVFPAGTQITARSYLAIYADETAFREIYADVPNAIGPYAKDLDNGGEALLLMDASGLPVDYVEYDDTPPWPVNPDGLRGSIELVDAFSDNDRAQAWRESDDYQGTPGRANGASLRFEAAGNRAPPQITEVEARPLSDPERQMILSSDEVLVRARVRDRDGIAAVRLEYQVVRAGDYISRTDTRFDTDWTSVDMAYDNEAYVALLPTLPHRTLLRYRIHATDRAATPAETWAPYQEDREPNFAYFVYDGVPDYVASRRSGFGALGFVHTDLEKVPVYHLLMDRGDFEEVMYVERDPNDNTYSWNATFVYEGRVHDHCGVRLRGSETSRYGSPKRSWKLRFNKGNRFRGHYNDGTPYPNRRARINLNRGVAGGLVEKLSHQLHYDAGALSPLVTLVHVRMITSEDEHAQFAGDFFGLFAEVQAIDKVLLRDGNRSLAEDSSLYKMKGFPNKKHSDCDPSVDDYIQFRTGSLSHSDREWFEENVNLPQYYSFRAAIQLTNNHDMDSEKNLGYYFDSEIRRWELIPWDVECSFRENPCSGEEPLAFKVPQLFRIEYRNRFRFVWQIQFDEERMLGAFHKLSGQIRNLADADVDRWAREPRLACPSCSDGQYSATPFETRVAWIPSFIRNRVTLAIPEFIDAEVPRTPRNAYPFEGLRPAPPVRLATLPFFDHESDDHAATHWMVIEPGGDWAYPRWQLVSDVHLEAIELPPEVTQPGMEFLFRAAHIDSTGRRSLFSEPTHVQVGPGDSTPPTPPSGLVVEHAGARSVSLSWTSSVDTESGIAGYQVLRDGEPLGAFLVREVQYTDFGPPQANTRYQVVAVNTAGLFSETSEPVDVEIPTRGLGGWQSPTGGWDYLFDARPGEAQYTEPFAEGQPVYLDGTWRRSNRNDWDGSPPGDADGAPGGVAVDIINGEGEDGGSASVLSMEDAGRPAANRRVLFLHDAGTADLVANGITLVARLRVHPSPVDLPEPKGQTPDSSFRGQIGVAHRASDRAHFSFWLDGGQLVTQSGASVAVEVLRFQSVWLVLEPTDDDQHRVRLFLNGSAEPSIDELVVLPTRGTESGFEHSYIEMGLSNLADSGAIQVDYVGYKAGVHLPVPEGTTGAAFRRGDTTDDGAVQHVDAFNILRYLFVKRLELVCLDAADADDSGRIDLSDAIFLLNYLYFGSGRPPPAPFPDCGDDPSGDAIGRCEPGYCGLGG